MKTRIITGLVGAPIVILCLIGPVWLNFILCLLGTGMAAYELLNCFQNLNGVNPFRLMGIIFAMLFGAFLFRGSAEGAMAMALIFMLVMFVWVMFMKDGHQVMDVVVSLFGALLPAVLFHYVYAIRVMEGGRILIFLPFLIAWGSDTFAYFAGSFFGKNSPKLCPDISPKKTVVGAWGGLVGAVVFVFLYLLIVQELKGLWPLLLAAPLLAVISQVGDLIFSVMKRACHIKDYGYLLPGHGGILDRVDSVLIVTPFVYFWLLLI